MCDSIKKQETHPESIVLNHVVLMAQQSLDPDMLRDVLQSS